VLLEFLKAVLRPRRGTFRNEGAGKIILGFWQQWEAFVPIPLERKWQQELTLSLFRTNPECCCACPALLASEGTIAVTRRCIAKELALFIGGGRQGSTDRRRIRPSLFNRLHGVTDCVSESILW
jgi:hypothetical protein